MRQMIFAAAMLLALAACAAPATPTPQPKAPAAPPAAATAATVLSCPATYPVPGDEFRSDDPKKLDAGGKPKLVEFYAVW